MRRLGSASESGARSRLETDNLHTPCSLLRLVARPSMGSCQGSGPEHAPARTVGAG